MNKKLDLIKILKNCPKGTKLYSTVHGEVEIECVYTGSRSIEYKTRKGRNFDVTCEGKVLEDYNGECTLFPSREQRDWSKFTASWYKKDRFDPKTLKPFDKVLVRDEYKECWCCDFFSYMRRDPQATYKCVTTKSYFRCCVPYNDETKHLIGTTEEAPEYYRYWED